MTTTQSDIRAWLKNAPKDATHMVIMCDTFDWDDYPVYCKSGNEARGYRDHPSSMQKPMECYDLRKPVDEQVTAHRALNWGD